MCACLIRYSKKTLDLVDFCIILNVDFAEFLRIGVSKLRIDCAVIISRCISLLIETGSKSLIKGFVTFAHKIRVC